jgi:hypothetical protein
MLELNPNPVESKPLAFWDYFLGFIALMSALAVGFVSLFWLAFGLGAIGNNGMSRFDAIGMPIWLVSLIAIIYFFVRLLRQRRYVLATIVSWSPITLFVILVYIRGE